MELEQRLTTLTTKAKEAEDAKGIISRIQPRRVHEVVTFRIHVPTQGSKSLKKRVRFLHDYTIHYQP